MNSDSPTDVSVPGAGIPLSELFKLLSDKIDSSTKRIEERIDRVEEELKKKATAQSVYALSSEIGKRIDRVEEELKKKATAQSVSVLSSEIGRVYELASRERVEKEYGRSYARSFEVEDLIGLARISRPKNESAEKEHSSQFYRHQERFSSLVDFVLSKKLHLDLEQRLISTPDPDLSGQLDKLKKLLADGKDEEAWKMLSLSSLGLASFSCLALKEGYAKTLEIDIRGCSVRLSPTVYQIQMGEIKKTKSNFVKPLRQLLIRLSIVSQSLAVLLSSESPPVTILSLGKVFHEGPRSVQEANPQLKSRFSFPNDSYPEFEFEHL